MARKAQLLKLSNDERSSLTSILRRGTIPARVQSRARVLDLLHRGHHPTEIATTLSLSLPTIFNIKRRYLSESYEAALYDRPRSGKPSQIDGTARAKITALACSTAPLGHARWTLRMLADKAIELGFCETISHSTVKEVLKKLSNRTAKIMVHRGDHGRILSADGRHPAFVQSAD
jgi:transposase